MLKARKVSGFDEATRAGDFWITDDRLTFICPCGCGAVAGIRIHTGLIAAGYWQWDGNRESPTCMPSIRIIGGCEWHGYLRNGDFITC